MLYMPSRGPDLENKVACIWYTEKIEGTCRGNDALLFPT